MTEATLDTDANQQHKSATLAQLMPSQEKRQRLRKWRYAKDVVSRYGVAVSGGSVVFALALIFVYLFYEVLPLLRSASVEPLTNFSVPGPAEQVDPSVGLYLERYLELGVRLTQSGEVLFFDTTDGRIREAFSMPVPDGVEVTSFASSDPREGLIAYGLSDGTALIGQIEYGLSFPDNQRLIEPKLTFPVGEEPRAVDTRGLPLQAIAVQSGPQGYVLAGITPDNRVELAIYRVTTSFMTGERQIRRESYELPALPIAPTKVLLDRTLRSMYVADATGMLHYYDISSPAQARRVQSVQVVPEGEQITALTFLVGTVSIIVGGSDGSVAQWFLIRDEDSNYALHQIRTFRSHPAPVNFITEEFGRKGFYTGDDLGNLGIHFATSARTLMFEPVSDAGILNAAVSPTNRGLLLANADNTVTFASLSNAHPQFSWTALWNRVHYEGRTGPDFVWQSSSASDDFEPKYSMMPLTIGTLKAAFYAMLFAMPLAIMGAIYTAYFMTSKMRGFVKPTIEVMEALPTVILGFLAGLWLAPFIENHLPAVFSILLLMPVAMVAMAFLWSRLPPVFRHLIGDGWEAALLVPVLLLVGWACIAASPHVENIFFGGSARQWLTDIGITYDQRNALVVGMAMGFAVIPTIFSIAEDAVFNVPKHLTQGSLALGASAWQTVVGVVLPTASPGIFSAVMIGFGRAVGETMIVLMATGNSPVMNFNIFEGMRTLSANIAVELKETAAGSSHYRILFLAALILFGFTFIVNTLAEVIRQRLRKRYASL
jgi:phosphate transport system permease protein